jgi:hypothetical protein
MSKFALALILVLAVSSFGCGDEPVDGPAPVETQPAAAATATPWPVPVPIIDPLAYEIVRLVEARDFATLDQYVEYQELPCLTETEDKQQPLPHR